MLRVLRPTRLYVAADGPRTGVATDLKNCAAARDIIKQGVDWPCEVKTHYLAENVGCKRGVIGAINWFFENVEAGIILEDDCLPDPSFFRYATELLLKYRHDKKIMTISGDNFAGSGTVKNQDSYTFSQFPQVWGWATWKRVWDQYDGDIKDWKKLRDSKWLDSVTENWLERLYWRYIFDRMYAQKIDTWDYQLVYYAFKHQMLTLIPSQNLVSNSGFGADATHTKYKTKQLNMTRGSLTFPLKHPSRVFRNKQLDSRIHRESFTHPLLLLSIIIRSWLNK